MIDATSFTDPAFSGAFRGPSSVGKRLVHNQRGFAESLGTQITHGRTRESARAERGTPEDQARKAAQEMVSLSFIQPILTQMSESRHTEGPFAASAAEKQFRGMQDRLLADELMQASNFPLVDRLASRLLARSGSPVEAQS